MFLQLHSSPNTTLCYVSTLFHLYQSLTFGAFGGYLTLHANLYNTHSPLWFFTLFSLSSLYLSFIWSTPLSIPLALGLSSLFFYHAPSVPAHFDQILTHSIHWFLCTNAAEVCFCSCSTVNFQQFSAPPFSVTFFFYQSLHMNDTIPFDLLSLYE